MSDKILLNKDSIRPNSFKYKEQQANAKKERPKAVVSRDQIVSSKPSFGKKLAGDFFNADFREVRDYAIRDKILPGLKGWVLDILEMAFFRRSSGRGYDDRRRYDGNPSYNYRASYRGQSYYDDRRRYEETRREPSREQHAADYRNVILLDRRGAEDVVEEMRRYIDKFGQCSIADLWDLVGSTSKPIDNNWGWTRQEDIGIRRVESGFLIDVAPARFLD